MSKKSFRDNPALQFMSRTDKDVSREVQEERKEEVRDIRDVREAREAIDNFLAIPVPPFEAKSKRFNMLMRPSLYAKLKKASEYRGTSVNDLINTIIENYMSNFGN